MANQAPHYEEIPADITVPVTLHSAKRPPSDSRTVWMIGNGCSEPGWYMDGHWRRYDINAMSHIADGIIEWWAEMPEVLV